jgi:hypothetical protein
LDEFAPGASRATGGIAALKLNASFQPTGCLDRRALGGCSIAMLRRGTECAGGAPLGLGIHGAVRRVRKRRERGCERAYQPSADLDTMGWARTAQVRDGSYPPFRRKMRAQRTVPLPQDPMGGAASPRSVRISGAEDCAPPGGRSPAQFFNRRGRRPCGAA